MWVRTDVRRTDREKAAKKEEGDKTQPGEATLSTDSRSARVSSERQEEGPCRHRSVC